MMSGELQGKIRYQKRIRSSTKRYCSLIHLPFIQTSLEEEIRTPVCRSVLRFHGNSALFSRLASECRRFRLGTRNAERRVSTLFFLFDRPSSSFQVSHPTLPPSRVVDPPHLLQTLRSCREFSFYRAIPVYPSANVLS